MKSYYVYIMTNDSKTLYIGITNDLVRRVYEHKNGLIKGFTRKYNLKKLVYYELINDAGPAIKREKQLKNWHRQWKINLIESANKGWKDLSVEFLEDAETSSA
jgi:putative endonuclease